MRRVGASYGYTWPRFFCKKSSPWSPSNCFTEKTTFVPISPRKDQNTPAIMGKDIGANTRHLIRNNNFLHFDDWRIRIHIITIWMHPTVLAPSRRKALVHVTPFFLCKKTSFSNRSKFSWNGLVPHSNLTAIFILGRKKPALVEKMKPAQKRR